MAVADPVDVGARFTNPELHKNEGDFEEDDSLTDSTVKQPALHVMYILISFILVATAFCEVFNLCKAVESLPYSSCGVRHRKVQGVEPEEVTIPGSS